MDGLITTTLLYCASSAITEGTSVSAGPRGRSEKFFDFEGERSRVDYFVENVRFIIFGGDCGVVMMW